MSDILVLVLRWLRSPLITLISVYAISIFGPVLMPGTDPSGQPLRLSVFDAFYVMTCTATTIGFGEVSYQRFERSVARMTDRFYVVCGYGQSGRRLVAALDRIGSGTVS